MTERIDYTFQLSTVVCEKLDEISFLLRQNTENAEKDNLLLLKEAWKSEASDLFEKKYLEYLSVQREIIREIEREAENVRGISRRLYLIEEAAKKAMSEKGTDV